MESARSTRGREHLVSERPLDDRADQFVGELGTDTAGELADRGLVGNRLCEWDQAEAAQVQRVGYRSHQGLITQA